MSEQASNLLKQEEFKETVIELIGLTKKYESFTAVNELNLSIQKGEIFGLLGPNGAGKTTTILMMLGLTERTSGEAYVLGLDPHRHSLKIKSKVGYMPDDLGFYDDRTALSNLLYTARLNQVEQSEQRAKLLLERVGLAEAMHKKVSSFSRGMRQRLGLADVLIKNPEIIILDEPTLGIDPEGVRELLQLLTELSKEENITVLLCSHHLQQVQQVCDRIGLFVQGNLVACGTVEELSNELIQQKGLIVELQLTDIDSKFNEGIEQFEEISKMETSINHVLGTTEYKLICKQDITPQIAKLATEHCSVHSIIKRGYQLDEIYHLYFDGGEAQ